MLFRLTKPPKTDLLPSRQLDKQIETQTGGTMRTFILTTIVLFSIIATASAAFAQELASPLSDDVTAISRDDLIDIIHRDRNARLFWFHS